MASATRFLVRLKAQVRERTLCTKGVSLSHLVTELSRYLVGWRGYFGFFETPTVLHSIDQRIRPQLRAILWRQWKHGRTRSAALHRSGAGKDLMAQTAGTSCGPWRISNSPHARHHPIQYPSSPGSASSLSEAVQPLESVEPPCTDPRARWCGSGGAARHTPIPILCSERRETPANQPASEVVAGRAGRRLTFRV